MKKGFVILLAIGVVIVLAFAMFFINIGDMMTGVVISGLAVAEQECNIVDLNADGIVNQEDQVRFNRLYETNYRRNIYCGYADLNNDEKADILDSNRFAELFRENYGKKTGPCFLRALDCQKNPVRTVCSDKDHGVEYVLRGICEDITGQKSDYCINERVLREYFCEGDSCEFIDYICPEKCEGGICIKDSLASKDSELASSSFFGRLGDFFKGFF